MKKLLLFAALAVISAIAFTSCGMQKNAQKTVLTSVQISRAPQQTFYDLQTGLQVNIATTRPNEEMTGWIHHLSGKSFFAGPTTNYIRSMGFKEIAPETDYKLTIKLKRVDLNGYNGASWADIEVTLNDSKGNEVFSQKDISTTSKSMILMTSLNEVYTLALEQINWNQIASFLKDKPKGKVKGSDLNQTILRWDVQSRPQGADIFWRVVSKTPEVKNTNNKYLQTTPYEATKALDIKGLTYENSSNVRVILRCEKDGYLSQEKEYDVRMIMDQEEISAFFRLVKEE